MVRGVSRPNSLVIQEALNLLSALGSSKGTTKKLLTEMKDVQDHNETVLANAKEVVENANKRETEVVEKEAELARNLIEAEELYDSRLLDITNGEEELQRRVDETAVRIVEEDERIKEREDEFHREQEEHLSAHTDKLLALTDRESVLKEDRDALEELKSSIEGREEKIKGDRQVLNDFQTELDGRKIKLDKRDARVRVAMEEDEAVVDGR